LLFDKLAKLKDLQFLANIAENPKESLEFELKKIKSKLKSQQS
jgi:hypothetical protein